MGRKVYRSSRQSKYPPSHLPKMALAQAPPTAVCEKETPIPRSWHEITPWSWDPST